MGTEGNISGEEPEYDKVTQASLNGIYVKAQEMDRGHNDFAAPDMRPPGVFGDVEAHASSHASDGADADSHASDDFNFRVHAGDAESHSSDGTSHASD